MSTDFEKTVRWKLVCIQVLVAKGAILREKRP